MNMLRTRTTILASVLAASFAFTACGPDGPDPLEQAKAAAAAKQKEEEAALAKRKADRQAKAEAAKKAEEEKKALVDSIAVIPEGTKLPKKLKKACESLTKAQDGFMLKYFAATEEAKTKWESSKGTALGMTRKNCQASKSIEVAVCQRFAYENATETLKKEVPGFLGRCIEKYGPGANKGKVAAK